MLTIFPYSQILIYIIFAHHAFSTFIISSFYSIIYLICFMLVIHSIFICIFLIIFLKTIHDLNKPDSLSNLLSIIIHSLLIYSSTKYPNFSINHIFIHLIEEFIQNIIYFVLLTTYLSFINIFAKIFRFLLFMLYVYFIVSQFQPIFIFYLRFLFWGVKFSQSLSFNFLLKLQNHLHN